jgi:hypothetical protein
MRFSRKLNYMDIKISLGTSGSEELDQETLGMLARDMNADLNRDFESRFEEQEGTGGGKGLLEFAPLILSLVGGSGGVVVSLLNVFNTYLSKAPKIELELQRENGRRIKLTGLDMEPDKIRETIKMMEEYLKE